MPETKEFKLPKDFQITVVNDEAKGAVMRNVATVQAGGISGTNCALSGGKFSPNDFHCKDKDEE